VFGGKNIEDFRKCYSDLKGKLSVKLENPRVKQISFRSFRHWKATAEYARTKDILHAKWLLGHRRIENTLVYTHLVNFGNDDYICKVAHSIDECSALIEGGFEYITDFGDAKMFRKRKKRLNTLVKSKKEYLEKV